MSMKIAIRAKANVCAGVGIDLVAGEVAEVDVKSAATLIDMDRAELADQVDKPFLDSGLRAVLAEEARHAQIYRLTGTQADLPAGVSNIVPPGAR